MARQPFETKIQDMVYGLEVGIGSRISQIALGLLGILCLMLLFTATQFRGLKDAEAMDAAQIGRNIMEGRGFSTQCIRPASMGQVLQVLPKAGPRVLNHPDLYHAPLYPVILSLGFRIFPSAFNTGESGGVFAPEQWVVVPINHLFLLLSSLLTFLIARRLLGNLRALLCTLSLFLSYQFWADSIAGMGLPIVTFFFLASFYFALLAVYHLEADKARLWRLFALLSAIAATLAVLTRYAALAAIPGILLYLALSFGKRRWYVPVLFCAVVLIGLAPWMVRNQKLSGTPFGLAPRTALYDSRLYAEDHIDRTLKPVLTFGSVLQSLRAKGMENLDKYYGHQFFSFGEGLLFPFFIAAFFFRFLRRDIQLFRWCIGLSMVCMLLTASIFGDSVYRVMNIFWPLVIIYGFAFFFLLLDRLQFHLKMLRVVVIVLLMLFSAIPMIFALLPPRVGVPYPPYFPPFIVSVSRMLEPTEVLMTDMPWATAWYGHRASIYLTSSLDGFFEINDYQQRISAIYFTTLTRDKAWIRDLKTGPYKTWQPILEGRVPKDFPLLHGFPMNNLDQLFLADRARWAEKS